MIGEQNIKYQEIQTLTYRKWDPGLLPIRDENYLHFKCGINEAETSQKQMSRSGIQDIASKTLFFPQDFFLAILYQEAN